jgi:hypothetical protein
MVFIVLIGSLGLFLSIANAEVKFLWAFLIGIEVIGCGSSLVKRSRDLTRL